VATNLLVSECRVYVNDRNVLNKSAQQHTDWDVGHHTFFNVRMSHWTRLF